MTGLVKPTYENYGFEEDDLDTHMTTLTRAFASEWACRLEIADCVTRASAHYLALMNDPHMYSKHIEIVTMKNYSLAL